VSDACFGRVLMVLVSSRDLIWSRFVLVTLNPFPTSFVPPKDVNGNLQKMAIISSTASMLW